MATDFEPQDFIMRRLTRVVGTRLTEREALDIFRHGKVEAVNLEGTEADKYIRVTVLLKPRKAAR